MSMLQVNLMHVFLIGPVIFGIGYKDPKAYMNLYNYLTILISMIIFTVRMPDYNWNVWGYRDYIRIIHLVGFTTLFGWIAYNKDNSHPFIYDIIKILGIMIIIIHLYLAMKEITKKKSKSV